MVNARGAYRRWVRRRLLVAGPALLTAAVVVVWFTIGASCAAWVRITGFALAAMVFAILANLVMQLWACGWHGGPDERFALHRQLKASGGIVVACLGLLATLACVPFLFDSGRERGAGVAGRPLAAGTCSPEATFNRDERPWVGPERIAVTEPVSKEVESIAPSPKPLEQRPDEAPPPQAPPARVPEVVVAPEPQAPPPSRSGSATAAPQEDSDAGQEESPHGPLPRPTSADLLGRDSEIAEPPKLERLGYPNEHSAGISIPIETRLDFFFLRGDGDDEGAAIALSGDIPIGFRDSVRASCFLGGLLRYEIDELEDPDNSRKVLNEALRWQHWNLEFVHRFVGYTRYAPFDFSLSAGLTMDAVEAPEGEPSIDLSPRVSPYLGLEAAMWQASTAGLILHVGQSLPVNLSGASAEVTDLSLTLRVDLSEGLSVHIGYRILLVVLRDFDRPFDDADEEEKLEGAITAPFAGIDLRF